MNWIQKIAARLFGFEYVLEIWNDTVRVLSARRIGKYMVLEHSDRRLLPAGEIAGCGATWEPLTPGAKKFYDREVVGRRGEG